MSVLAGIQGEIENAGTLLMNIVSQENNRVGSFRERALFRELTGLQGEQSRT